MARPTPDPSFGAGFDAAKFRDAIRNTMVMGMPNATEMQATFRWSPQREYAPEDSSHDPYDWTQTPTSEITHPDVIVPVAMEFTSRVSASGQTVVGEFDESRVILTVLDVDYELVRGADLVLLGGNVYTIDFVAPPIGLFEVDVFQIYTTARDES